MPDLQTVLRFELWTFLIALILLVFYQIMTGKISTDALLYETNERGERKPSATQLQAMVFSVGGALYYLFIVLSHKDGKTFPDIPDALLFVLGGSHLLYLGDKLLTLFVQKIKSA